MAPVMTDLDASGGGSEYYKLPKGNLDITGQYFIWTTNTGGNRIDAFLVKVPLNSCSVELVQGAHAFRHAVRRSPDAIRRRICAVN